VGVKVREKPKGSGRWYVFIDYQGKRKAKYVGTEKAASQAAEKIQARLVLGEFAIEPKRVVTFKEYREQWLKTYAEAHCKYSTFKSYKTVFEIHLNIFDARPLNEISRQDVAALISKKLVEEKKSKGTVRNILAPLREMLNHAVDEGILTANPAQRIGRFAKHTSGKANRLKIDPFNRQEVGKLLETAGNHYQFDSYALILCAVRTGMRMGELFGLQWPDLDFNSRFVQVQRSWVRNREETPKSHQLRRIDMSKQLAETFQDVRRRRQILFFEVRAAAERLRVSGEPESDIPRQLSHEFGRTPDHIRYICETKDQDLPAWVFMNEVGKPLDPKNITERFFKKLLEKAELRRVRFHDLRHTFASLLLQQGESPQYVKEQMGHHSIQVTVDIYGHLIPGSNRRAVDRLDDQPKRNRRAQRQPAATAAQPPVRLRVLKGRN
jgi:integrase